jgi:hypothetical protein
LAAGHFVVVAGAGRAAGGATAWVEGAVTGGAFDAVERSRETQKKPPIIRATTTIKAIHITLDKLLAVRKVSDLLSKAAIGRTPLSMLHRQRRLGAPVPSSLTSNSPGFAQLWMSPSTISFVAHVVSNVCSIS